jgi:proprotein convertase subtilisin/kexin type 2
MEVYVKTSSADHSDLKVTLQGSTGGGTLSTLSEPHYCRDPNASYAATNCGDLQDGSDGWRFGVARHLGEAGNQTWTLKVADIRAVGDGGRDNDGGTFVSYRIVIYGR